MVFVYDVRCWPCVARCCSLLVVWCPMIDARGCLLCVVCCLICMLLVVCLFVCVIGVFCCVLRDGVRCLLFVVWLFVVARCVLVVMCCVFGRVLFWRVLACAVCWLRLSVAC